MYGNAQSPTRTVRNPLPSFEIFVTSQPVLGRVLLYRRMRDGRLELAKEEDADERKEMPEQ